MSARDSRPTADFNAPESPEAPDPNCETVSRSPIPGPDAQAPAAAISDATADFTDCRPESGSLPDIPGYAVEAEIARGGMGVVYRARHLALNRPAAIKMILGGRYHDPAARIRFLVEAEAVAQLDHPYIVHVHEFGSHEELPYFVLEYVGGGTLAAKLAGGDRLTPRSAAELVVKLADGVAAAHAKGIVHRDLKPANILLTEAGEPKIADFGLAKIGGSDMTATGAVLGTPSYMSPEQAAGRVRDVGTPADVYALGAILYELLCGRPPFKGESSLETIRLVLTEEPTRPRSVVASIPRDLETICLKCLEKEPGKRYPTVAALAADLRAFLEDKPIAARSTGTVERTWKWVRRNPMATIAAGVVIASMVLSTAASYMAYMQTETALLAEALRVQEREQAIDEQDKALKVAAEAISKRDEAIKRAEERAEELKYQLGTGNFLLASAAYDNRNVELAAERLERVPEEQRGWEWRYLKRQSTGGIFTLYGHTGEVDSVSYSPDGRRIVTGSTDHTAKVWDARSGTPLLELKGHTGGVTSVSFSPDGSRIVTGSDDKTAKVWDAWNGMPLLELTPRTQGAHQRRHERELFA